MKIRRFVTDINNGSFESLLSKLENHEVFIDSKIQAVKKNAVKVSTHLGVVRYRLQKLMRREAELESSIERWRLRAVQQNKVDQKKALGCVQALNKSQELLDQIRTQLSLERRLEQDLQIYLAENQEKLSQLERQRNRLSEQAAETPIQTNTLPLFNEVYTEGVFADWEASTSANQTLPASLDEGESLQQGSKQQLSQQLNDICKRAEGEALQTESADYQSKE